MKKTIVTTNKNAAPAQPAGEQPAGPGPRPKILKTSDLPGGARSTEIDDKNFVSINATLEELADLRKQIEARQAPAAPGQPEEQTATVLVCTNPRCRAWGSYPTKKDVDRALGGTGSCIFCNYRNLKDGGRLRRADAGEKALFWSERKRLAEVSRLRMKQMVEIERERSRLGLDRVGYLSIDSDPSIKRGRG